MPPVGLDVVELLSMETAWAPAAPAVLPVNRMGVVLRPMYLAAKGAELRPPVLPLLVGVVDALLPPLLLPPEKLLGGT